MTMSIKLLPDTNRFKYENVEICFFYIKFASSTLNSELEKGKERCFY